MTTATTAPTIAEAALHDLYATVEPATRQHTSISAHLMPGGLEIKRLEVTVTLRVVQSAGQPGECLLDMEVTDSRLTPFIPVHLLSSPTRVCTTRFTQVSTEQAKRLALHLVRGHRFTYKRGRNTVTMGWDSAEPHCLPRELDTTQTLRGLILEAPEDQAGA